MRTSLAIILAALMFGLAAFAQNVSDLQPAAPQPPPGAGTAYYPGMPVPQPPAVQPEGAPPAAAKGGAKEPTGLVLMDDNGLSVDDQADVQVDAANGTHVVRRGDTLWGVSSTYFHNPWYWPKLWAFNPSITNPHWIYPGDIIRLSSGGGGAAVEARPELPEPGPRKLVGRVRQPTGLFMRQHGFVEPGELEAAGTVNGSKEEKIMLATMDEAYVQYSAKQPLVVGEKYSVYHPIRTVKHPVTGKRIGEIVEIFGEVQVKSTTDGHVARVMILSATDSIERGFRVGPLRRTFKLLDPKPADRDLQGVVVETLRPLELVASDMLVFIDRGSKDGVALGNQFRIVRRGDGYQPLLWRGDPIDDKRFPRETLGIFLIVDLRDTLSTGWVLRSAKEAAVGDRVELHSGE